MLLAFGENVTNWRNQGSGEFGNLILQGAECLRAWVLGEPQSASPDPVQEGYLMQGKGASLTFPGQRQEREVLYSSLGDDEKEQGGPGDSDSGLVRKSGTWFSHAWLSSGSNCSAPAHVDL